MDNQKSLFIPGNKLEKDYGEYYKASPKRRWEVSFDYKTKIFLNTDEKNYFIDQINKGVNTIQIGPLVLTSKFQYIVPHNFYDSGVIINEKGEKKYDYKEVYEGNKLIGYEQYEVKTT